MDDNNLVEMAKLEIPEFADAYEYEFKRDPEALESGSHIVFSFVFVPLLKKAISNDNDDLARRMCLFLEKMECSGDSNVAEVAEFTVLEELCDDFSDAELEKYLFPETKFALKSIRRYIPEN